MIEKRRIEITLETRQVSVIRSARASGRPRCPECVPFSRMITPDEAAVLSDSSTREIYRLIESGRLHFIETDDRLLFVCLNLLPTSSAQASEAVCETKGD